MNEELLSILQSKSIESLTSPIVEAINHHSLDELKEQLTFQRNEQQQILLKSLYENKSVFLQNFKLYLRQKKILETFEQSIQEQSDWLQTQQLLHDFDKQSLEQKKKYYIYQKIQSKIQKKVNKISLMIQNIQNYLQKDQPLPCFRIITKIENLQSEIDNLKENQKKYEDSQETPKEKYNNNYIKIIYDTLYQKLEQLQDQIISQFLNAPNPQKETFLLDYSVQLFPSKQACISYIFELRKQHFKSLIDQEQDTIQNFLKEIEKYFSLQNFLEEYLNFQSEIWLSLGNLIKDKLISIILNEDYKNLLQLDLKIKDKQVKEDIQSWIEDGKRQQIDQQVKDILLDFQDLGKQSNLVLGEQYKQKVIDFSDIEQYEHLYCFPKGFLLQNMNLDSQIQMKFTEVIDIIVSKAEKFITIAWELLKNDPELVHIKLDALYLNLASVYQSQVQELNPVQLAQSATNIQFLRMTILHFQQKIETDFKIISFRDYQSFHRFTSLQALFEENLSQILKQKIDLFLDNYKELTLMPKTVNSQEEVNVVHMMQYLLMNVQTLCEIDSKYDQKLLPGIFKLINLRIMDLLFSKKYNIVGLSNLDLDLQYIFNTQKGVKKDQFLESLKELRQFLDLFLHHSVLDLVDREKYERNFYLLQKKKMILLLKNHEKIDHKRLPNIRKRDIQNVLEQLKKDVSFQ